jgi:peptide chain release factor 1
MSSIFDKLESIVRRNGEIEAEMALPEVAADFEQIQSLAKERAGLEELVEIAHVHQTLLREEADLKALVAEGGDPEIVLMAREELETVEIRLEDLAQELRLALAQGPERRA